MRMYDRLIDEGSILPPGTWTESLARDLASRTTECTVFLCDHVAEYWFSDHRASASFEEADYPNLAPPVSPAFFEYRIPRSAPAYLWENQCALGVTATWHDLEKSQSFLAHPLFQSMVPARPPGVRWALELAMFADYGNGGKVLGPTVWQSIPVAADGTAVRGPEVENKLSRSVLLLNDDVFTDKRSALAMVRFSSILARVVLLTISFLHCKNVAVNEIAPSRQVRRARERAGKPPATTYKVLDIAPMTRVLRTEGQSDEVGIRRALHICRGHFVTYDERPLFGKIRGTFWKESHVRGNPSQGVVVKDYRVHAPQEATPFAQSIEELDTRMSRFHSDGGVPHDEAMRRLSP